MPTDLQQLAQQYINSGASFTPPTPGTFGQNEPDLSLDDQIGNMANSDKLTRTEQKIYKALPGVTSWMENNRIMGKTYSEQLDRFNNGWMGKTLQKLDILAEGLERSAGLVTQMVTDKNFDMSQLQSAWYAGSLTWDMANLPQVVYGDKIKVYDKSTKGFHWEDAPDGKGNNVVGLTINSDLPGSGGLNQARAEIQRWIDLGMSPKEATERVRDDYYQGLGALALRAQINDMWGHVLGDPLNILTGYLKPLQALKARKFTALSKIAGGTEEVLGDLSKVAKLADTATDAAEALKFTDEAYRLAQLAGDTKQAAQYAEKAADIAKSLGNVEDAAKYADDAARFLGMGAEDAAKFTDDALKVLGDKQLTRADRFYIMAGGGDPFRPSAFGKRFENVPILGRIAKQFQLTPESKAKELVTLMSDNYRHVIGRMMTSPNAEKEFVDFASRVGKGATGIEYGHGMMTVQGRMVQSFSKGIDTDLARLFSQYDAIRPQRELMELVSQNLGQSTSKFLKLAGENPEAVLQMIAKHADANPLLARMLQDGTLTADNLKSMSKILSNVPHNKQMFFAQALDAIETHAMRQAVVKFGVKEKGVLTRWSDAMKSAESLAFLKLNPGYPIRNKINNDLTMIARGLFGHLDDAGVDAFWKEFGFDPKRLGDAFTPIGEKSAQNLSNAEKLLEEALRGGNYGTAEKIKDFFQNINLGKLDMAGYWGQRIEQAASRKAYTLGTMQGLNLYKKELKVSKYFDKKLLSTLDELDPSISKKLQNAISSSDALESKLFRALGENLNVSPDNILDDVASKLGINLEDQLGTEVLETIRRKLPDAVKSGNFDAVGAEIRAGLEKHINDLFEKQIENLVEHTKAQMVAGGPNVWNKKLLEARDLFYGARMEYSIRMPEATRLAREASLSGDFTLARALWEKEALDARNYHNRLFRRMDAMLDGMEQGTAELAKRGTKLPFAETKKTFREFKKTWEDFFAETGKMKEEFWDAVKNAPQGQKPKWDDVHTKIEAMYKKAGDQEDMLMQRLDDSIASMIDDPATRSAYINARDQLAEMNRIDKEAVSQIFEQASRVEPEERALLWNDFWQARAARYQEMRSVDAASILIQQGDPNAMAQFQRAAAGSGDDFNIYSLANEYGIASATDKGIRNDRRVLSTVNKYLQPETAGKKVPVSKVAEVPRNELPPAVSEKFKITAERYVSELSAGQAGKRTKAASYGTTNPEFYRDLNKEFGMGKPQVNAALERIIADKGKDKGVAVERVKEMIYQEIRYGSPETGTPPDLYVLQEMGASKKMMNEALDDFNEITKQRLTLQEAIDASTPAERALNDLSKPYFDADGKLIQPKKYTRVEDIPEDVARQAFEARAAEKGLEVSAKQKVTPQFIADINKVIPELQPLDLGMDQAVYGRMQNTIDEIMQGATAASKKPPLFINNLPEDVQRQVMRGIDRLKDDMSSVRYRAQKFGEWRRDSALLNYNRRTNFDNNLAHVAPFVFWSTSSMWQWAIESIDRPAMLTNYLRIKKMFETSGLQRDGMPSRVKGKVRINLPFAPEWMGEQFIDPLRVALPFDNWIAPFEQFQKEQNGFEGRVERVLEQQLREGSISQEEYDNALDGRVGEVWDFAEAITKQNDEGDNYDAWDFASTLASPHAPIMWAYNAAFGDKEDIGPFAPLSRIMRNAATAMGVEDWNNSKWNLEAKIRKQMGLNAFDKWDDYRIKRAASNMAGDGTLTPDEAKEAIAIAALVEQGKMSPEDAKKASEAYRLAVKNANQEFTGGAGAFAFSLLGISVTSVPKGENNLRKLQDDFGLAYQKYNKANESLEAFIKSHSNLDPEEAADLWEQQNPGLAKDGDALRDFFDENPEYETRLGLFDKPEEQVHKFYVDKMWSVWNEMPKVNQDEIKDHLGTEFQQLFLDKNTRSYDDIPVETMAVWMKMMNVDPLGGLTADQRLLVSLYGRVQMTDPETANRVQVFYDKRKEVFPEYYDLQSGYFQNQSKAARNKYLADNPELKAYWDWRRGFMTQNPDLVPYLTDNEKDIEKAKNTVRTKASVPTANEIRINLSPTMNELLTYYAQNNDAVPTVVMNELNYLGEQYGMSGQQLMNIYAGGQGVR